MSRDTRQRFCWAILLAMVGLMLIGIFAIRTAELADARHLHGHAAKQMIFAGVGLAVFFAAAFIDYRLLGAFSPVLALVTLALLTAVFFLPASRGSHRWIPLAGGFMLQPSELAKLAYVICLAWFLRDRQDHRRLPGLLAPALITLVPLVLILKEPDLGTALLLPPTLAMMLFAAGARRRHLAVIALLGLTAVLAPMPHRADEASFAPERRGDFYRQRRLGPLSFYRPDPALKLSSRPMTPVAYCRVGLGDGPAWDIQPFAVWLIQEHGGDHQIKRIVGWLRQNDPRIQADVGMQQYISMTVLASGGLNGQTAWKTTAMGFRMLPDDHTDFIFSVIGGQWGFVGCLAALGLYLTIFLFGSDIAIACREPFGRLLAVGVMTMLAVQMFINVGMTMGLMPITGMTLPLVSYGGSSMLVNATALGLLVNVGRRREHTLAPEPFYYE